MPEPRELVRCDRVRALLRTQYDYLIPVVKSDDSPIEVTGDFRLKDGGTRTMTTQERDNLIAKLERETAHREGKIVPSEKVWWEAAREWRDTHGSYRALERAMSTLTANDQHFLYLYHQGTISRTAFAEEREEHLVMKLQALMPDFIELPAGLHLQHHAKLVLVARDLSRKGNRIKVIADMLGIGRKTVGRLLKQAGPVKKRS